MVTSANVRYLRYFAQITLQKTYNYIPFSIYVTLLNCSVAYGHEHIEPMFGAKAWAKLNLEANDFEKNYQNILGM